MTSCFGVWQPPRPQGKLPGNPPLRLLMTWKAQRYALQSDLYLRVLCSLLRSQADLEWLTAFHRQAEEGKIPASGSFSRSELGLPPRESVQRGGSRLVQAKSGKNVLKEVAAASDAARKKVKDASKLF